MGKKVQRTVKFPFHIEKPIHQISFFVGSPLNKALDQTSFRAPPQLALFCEKMLGSLQTFGYFCLFCWVGFFLVMLFCFKEFLVFVFLSSP